MVRCLQLRGAHGTRLNCSVLVSFCGCFHYCLFQFTVFIAEEAFVEHCQEHRVGTVVYYCICDIVGAFFRPHLSEDASFQHCKYQYLFHEQAG